MKIPPPSESFNNRLRDDLLNGGLFYGLKEPRGSKSSGGVLTTRSGHTVRRGTWPRPCSLGRAFTPARPTPRRPERLTGPELPRYLDRKNEAISVALAAGHGRAPGATGLHELCTRGPLLTRSERRKSLRKVTCGDHFGTSDFDGGEGGIRTLGTVACTPVFESSKTCNQSEGSSEVLDWTGVGGMD